MRGEVRSTRLARVALALILTGLGLSACGGEERPRPAREGSTSASQRVTPETIDRCLKQAQIRTSKKVDPIAKEAGVGALAAVFPGNYVNLVVERTADEASSTVRAYEESAQGPRMRLEQTGAVVAAYAKTPTSQQKEVVSRCVKGT
jgi:hypothetical protein